MALRASDTADDAVIVGTGTIPLCPSCRVETARMLYPLPAQDILTCFECGGDFDRPK